MPGTLLGDVASGISSGITAGIVVAILAFIMERARRGQPEVNEGRGRMIFRQNRLVAWIGATACIVMPLGITILLFFVPIKNSGEAVAIVCLYTFFIGLGAPLLWDSLKFALIVGPEGIECHSPWKGRFSIPWDNVDRISFSALSSWFIIRSKTGKTFHVTTLVSGLNRFLDVCEKHLSPKQLEPAKGGYRVLQRNLPD